jgi:hypothetical protein
LIALSLKEKYWQVFAKWVLFFAFQVTCIQLAYSQSELVFSAGSTHFLGDLGGSINAGSPSISDLNLQGTRYTFGSAYRRKFARNFAIRTGMYYARLSADDRYTSNRERHNRNLNFFSPLIGANGIFEIHLLKTKNKNHRLYLFAGIEVFRFDPRTKYDGKTVRLQPLGTEGQFFMPGKSPYKLNSFAIPFGLGFNFLNRTNGYWSLELSSRKTFTDYIDDVSTNYVDKTQLLASNGQTAVDLSDRNLGEIPGFGNAGSIRGKPTYTDNFFFISINYNIMIGKSNYAKLNGKKERGLVPGKNDCYQF